MILTQKIKFHSMLAHNLPIRVYYEDTDAGGIVYHASYLKFTERARTEWLRSLGAHQSKLIDENQIQFVVYHLEIDFLAPGFLDDLLDVQTTLIKLRKASMELEQNVFCKDKKIAALKVFVACVTTEKKPAPWPEKLKASLQTQLKSTAQ